MANLYLLKYTVAVLAIVALQTRRMPENSKQQSSASPIGSQKSKCQHENYQYVLKRKTVAEETWFRLLAFNAEYIEAGVVFQHANFELGTTYTSIRPNCTECLKNYINGTKLLLFVHGYSSCFNYLKHYYEEALSIRAKREQFNVVFVDWGRFAGAPYLAAAANVHLVGKRTAALLNYLDTFNASSLENTYVFSHSVGSHGMHTMAAFLAPRKVRMITAMDPALPGYWNKKSTRLAKDDALTVKVVHTTGSGGFLDAYIPLAIHDNIGKLDFYITRGIRQRSCHPIEDIPFGQCSHSKVNEYVAENIIYPESFIGFKCPNHGVVACSRNDIAYLSHNYDEWNKSGIYFLEVADNFPYGIGRLGFPNLKFYEKLFLSVKEWVENIFK